MNHAYEGLPTVTEAQPHHPRAGRIGLVSDEHVGFNGWLAVQITKLVGSMWCAYVFAAIALISLPDAIHQGISRWSVGSRRPSCSSSCCP